MLIKGNTVRIVTGGEAMLKTVSYLITVLLMTFLVTTVHSTNLVNVSVTSSTKASENLQFSFSTRPKFRQFILKNPTRIVFDFSDTTLKTSLKKLAAGSHYIQDIRYAIRNRNDLRVVLDVAPGTIVSKKIKGRANKVLFALAKQQRGTTAVVNKVSVPSTQKKQLKVSTTPTKLRDVVIVIDPGHGGKDPGAIGQNHVQEKKVVLEIAKRLQHLINQQRGMKAYLTRGGDYYISLRTRLARARKYNADMFISIHADAFHNRRSRGASVYTLSQRGATSEAARWLAAKENYSELGGVDLSELDDANGMVRSVLIDLSQTATIGASFSVGEQILQNLGRIAKLHHESVEQARFVVLKSPDIPSLLIETGFISNHAEERLLASSRYQQKLAQSIIKGIKNYFKEHPPRNSYLAHQSKYYQVVRGDTLSGIAKKLQVSVDGLKKFNKLSSSRVYIGQKLVIPI